MTLTIMLVLQDALGIPVTKIPVSLTTFVSYVLPPLVCYFAAATEAITPHTRAVRMALWPVVTLLAFRAAVSIDMSRGNPGWRFLNIELVRFMTSSSVHSLSWALTTKPLVRTIRPANASPSIVMDALDLTTNLRGIGWDWSRGLYIPRQTRPKNRVAFLFYTFASLFGYGWLSGALHLSVQTFTTDDLGVSKATIYDPSLPPLARYLRASIITTLGGLLSYATLQLGYDLLTIPAVLLLGQDPVQWPPALDRPWCATSLHDFWNRRWHQWYRHMFVVAARPATALFGRPGTVLGAFLASGVFHYITAYAFDSRAEVGDMVLAFGIMPPALLAERAFRRYTGRKVGGLVGWVWTFLWLLLCGSVMINGFVRVGVYSSSSAVDSQLPLHALIERLVRSCDAWLHTFSSV